MTFNHLPALLSELKRKNLDGRRVYETPGGKFPSVTSITSLASRDSIMKWRKRVGEKEANKISTKASGRGTRVHQICEDYLNNNVLSGLMPDAYAMFKPLQPILDEYIDNIHALEAPLWSSHLRVAGTVDCIAEFSGKLSVIDFKTSNKPKKEEWIENYFMQCAAYAVMYEERTGTPINRLAVLITVQDSEPQIFVKKRDDYINKFIELRDQFERENGIV